MRKRRKWLATLMTIAMLMTMIPAGAFAQGGETGETTWDVSKSKTATPLTMDENGDYYSDVTLSLPSAEEKLESDVVLVLDKSTSATLEDKALDMLSNLQQTVKETDAKVDVGVVIFNKEAHTDGVLHDLATEYDTIKEAITEDISSGTNTHAGLLAGKRMLDEDTDVLDSRKYLVFVSDGITYMYNEEPTAIGLQNGDKTNIFAGPDNWNTKYGNNEAPADWDKWLSDIEAQIDTDGTTYDTPYDTDYSNSYIAWDERDDHAMSIDKALYLTDQVYNEAKAEGYHCYAMKASTNADHPWASSFMEYLSGGETVSFDGIGDDINYLLDTGSVTDYMGYDQYEDGSYYNFDFVNDPDKLKLTVGGEQLKVTEIEENKYGFGKENENGTYDYVLTYTKGESEVNEHFVWEINVPVTNWQKVQLTYKVQLMDPRTDAGTYGVYDKDGSANETGLYTNNNAILEMQDTIGSEPTTEQFNKPTVSYTVEEPIPEGTVGIRPANITIYTGGDGYESVVNGSGNEIGAVDQGLPTPGFYITLPKDLNEWMIKNADPADVTTINEGTDNEQKVVDLSKYLTFTYDYEGQTRAWALERYDKTVGNDSMAYSQYIYRLTPAIVDGEEMPIRLQFTDAEGAFMTTDDFTVNLNELYHEYTMSIYPGGLEQKEVQAVLTAGDKTSKNATQVQTGTLTVRGGTDNETATTTVVKETPQDKVNNVTAQVDSDTKFYINASQLEVADAEKVELLVDSVVADSNNTLQNAAVSKFDDITAQHECEMNYLDLVDTSNGNAWVTASNDVTVHWPIPADATDDSEFYIVHYEGLDRNDNDALGNEDYTQELYSVEKGNLKVENGNLTFTVDSFSPFALFYTAEENDNPGGPVIPSDPDDPDPDTPDLNTDDHYSYIVGYPEDYRTGEATDDESLWPVKPQGNITRAEVATIFYRLLTNDARDENWTTSNSFTDVSADSWYNTPVSTLSAMGLIEGYEDGSFRPDNPITRAEFAAIAGRFFTDNDAIYEPGTFSDIEGAEWFADAVQAAKDHDIIGGYPDGSFKPNNPITRAEACSIVNRTTKRVPDADHLLALDEMRNWPDNADTSAWYYADMQEATNGHYYDYVLDENDEIVREEWTSERAPIDWEQVEEELEASH